MTVSRTTSRGWRGSSDRPAPKPREAWTALIVAAGSQDAEDLRPRLARIERAPFPIEGASARCAAAGLVELARAFVAGGTPERRDLIAPAMVAAAKAVDALLSEDAVAIAQRGWLRD